VRDLTWAEVVLGVAGIVQTIALAWIAKRGVVLPPVNRRTPAKKCKEP
jgi:hypothetical protein